MSDVEWWERTPAVFVPDAPGFYEVVLTVLDACNASAVRTANITLRCDHDARAALGHDAVRSATFAGANAFRFADFAHPLGWFPPTRLSGAGSYAEHMGWYNSTLEPYQNWTDAPEWPVPYQESDGLLYEWSIEGAPAGSALVLTQQLAFNSTTGGGVDYTSPEGHVYLHADASRGEHARSGLPLPLPRMTRPNGITTRFSPDVLGMYDFDLRVSNACGLETVPASVAFVCSESPVVGVDIELVDEDICMNGAVYDAEAATTDNEGEPLYFHFELLEAPNASLSPPLAWALTRRDYVWNPRDTNGSKYLYPDVRGAYSVRVDVTDGCTAPTFVYTHEVVWLQMCTDMASNANAGISLLLLAVIFCSTGWHLWRNRDEALHPLDPELVKEDAQRLLAYEEQITHGRLKLLQRSGVFEKTVALARAVKSAKNLARMGAPSAALDAIHSAAQSNKSSVDLDTERRLLPPSVPLWRSLRLLCVITEGVSLLCLAFTPNTWFNGTITYALSFIGLNLPAPLVYVAMWGFFMAVLMIVLAPSRPFRAPRRRRRGRGKGQPAGKYAPSAGGGGSPAPSYYSAPRGGVVRGNGSPSSSRSPSPSPPSSPMRSSRSPSPPGSPMQMASLRMPPGRARASWPSPSRSARSGRSNSSMRSARVDLRNSLVVDPKTRRLMQIWELSPAQLRAHKRKLLWLIVKTRVRRLAFVLRARVHNLVYSSRRWIALVLFEALLVPAVVTSLDMVVCTYDDDKVPYPHLHKDPTLRCWRGAHLLFAGVGVATFCMVVPLALEFATEHAHDVDLRLHEPRMPAALRVGLKALAAAMAVAAGGPERERETPLGEYGPPEDGSRPHAQRDSTQLQMLTWSALALLAVTLIQCPARGAGAMLNALRASFFALTVWAALISANATTASTRSTYETAASSHLIAAIAGGLLVFGATFHAARRRAQHFCIPPKPLKHSVDCEDPRVRVLALLATNEVPASPYEGGSPPRGSPMAGGSAALTRLQSFGKLAAGGRRSPDEEVFMWVMLLQACAAGAPSSSAMRVRALEMLERATRTEAGLFAMGATEAFAVVKVALSDSDAQVRIRACEVLAAAAEDSEGLKHVLALDAENWRVVRSRNDRMRKLIREALLSRVTSKLARALVPSYVQLRYGDPLPLRMWTRNDLETLDELAVRIMDEETHVALAANRAVMAIAATELGLDAILGGGYDDRLGQDLGGRDADDDLQGYDGANPNEDAETVASHDAGSQAGSQTGRRSAKRGRTLGAAFKRMTGACLPEEVEVRQRMPRASHDNPLMMAIIESTSHTSNVVRSAGSGLLIILMHSDVEGRTVPMLQAAFEHEDWRVRLRTLDIANSVLATHVRDVVQRMGSPEEYSPVRGLPATISPVRGRGRGAGGFDMMDPEGDEGSMEFQDMDQAPAPATVEAMLTEEFVAAIAALLNDLESLEVRVAAIELLAHVWDAAGGGQRPSSPSPHSSPGRSPARMKVRRDGQEGGEGLDLLMASGAIPLLMSLSKDGDDSTREHARDFLSKLTQSDEGAADMLADQTLADRESHVLRRHTIVRDIRAAKAGMEGPRAGGAAPAELCSDDEGGPVVDDPEAREVAEGYEDFADEAAKEERPASPLKSQRTARSAASHVRRARAAMAPPSGRWVPGKGDTRPWRQRVATLIEAGGSVSASSAALPRGPHERSRSRQLAAAMQDKRRGV